MKLSPSQHGPVQVLRLPEDIVRIAADVNELGVREQLEQRTDAGAVGAVLDHKPLSSGLQGRLSQNR